MSCILILYIYELSGQFHVCVLCVQYSSTCTYVLKCSNIEHWAAAPSDIQLLWYKNILFGRL